MNAPENRALATATDQPRYAIAPQITGRDLILHAENLNAIIRVAEMMAKSRSAVPKHLRENPGGCMAVTMQAMRWNMDPFALAVKTYQIEDNPIAYEGQAVIAALNNSPLLATRLTFEWFGQWEKIVGKFKQVESKTKKDNDGNFKKYIVPAWDFNTDEEGLGVIVSATLVGEKEPRTLTLLMKQCRTRNSPLWTEDPKQQIAYLGGRRWGRLHTPDVIMGVYTPDELEEPNEKFMGPADVVPEPPKTYPQELFDANFPEWKKYIEAGRKTAAQIIAMANTKFPLTDDQKKQVSDVKAKQATEKAAADTPAAEKPAAEKPAAETASKATDAGPKVTFAQVATAIADAMKAKNTDKLAEAEDLIGAVADPAQRAELVAGAKAARAELEGAQQ
jgi:hypothetical protein